MPLYLKRGKVLIQSRDDKIRTCDPTPPRRVRYRAALHPESRKSKAIIYNIISLPSSSKYNHGIIFVNISGLDKTTS